LQAALAGDDFFASLFFFAILLIAPSAAFGRNQI